MLLAMGMWWEQLHSADALGLTQQAEPQRRTDRGPKEESSSRQEVSGSKGTAQPTSVL